ncbi:hypothetical protein DL96DRAFT_1796782 [Flagelloscypha sp. PMI_526]|nr:hypothetical protein DL96DRAFT_1796782 [Flagelloscypha sp. PMI_526]
MAESQLFPKRSWAQVHELLTAPGTLHETKEEVISDRVQRVYKQLWPSVRDFWLESVAQHGSNTYTVFDTQRETYNSFHQHVLSISQYLTTTYAVKKGRCLCWSYNGHTNIYGGERIGILARNSIAWLEIFWACQMLGAVVVCFNAWLPVGNLEHCISLTAPRLIFVDTERAALIHTKETTSLSSTKFLVMESDDFQKSYHIHIPNPQLLAQDSIDPEDYCLITFTSGTTGMPKGVLSTQRQFLTNVLNLLASSYRTILRQGNNIPAGRPPGPPPSILLSVPLFHVTGLTSYSMITTFFGGKLVMMRKWDPELVSVDLFLSSLFSSLPLRLIETEHINLAGGVPAMVSDLISTKLADTAGMTFLFGGSPASEFMLQHVQERMPSAVLSQGYGLTETNSVAVGISGPDYIMRPRCAGLPSPVNDLLIVKDGVHICQPMEAGEVWIRGPNVSATGKAITHDGWLKSGDVGYLDEEGILYIKDRIKDIIIRGGENIDSVAIENALYAYPGVREAVAIPVPDERLGQLPAAIVCVRPQSAEELNERDIRIFLKSRLPSYAVPVMILIQTEPFELTPSGKIIKTALRRTAEQAWLARAKAPRTRL